MAKKQILVHPEGHEKAGQPTGVIQFVFANGTQEFDTRKVPGMEFVSDVQAFLASTAGRQFIHGGSQKVGDSYAGAKAEENPEVFAHGAAGETIAQILKGEWRAARESGPRVTDLAVAASRVAGQSLEQAMEFLGTLDEEQTKAFRAKPKIKAALAQIAAEKAIAKAKAAAEAAEKAGE